MRLSPARQPYFASIAKKQIPMMTLLIKVTTPDVLTVQSLSLRNLRLKTKCTWRQTILAFDALNSRGLPKYIQCLACRLSNREYKIACEPTQIIQDATNTTKNKPLFIMLK